MEWIPELTGWPTVGIAVVVALGVSAVAFRVVRRVLSAHWLSESAIGFMLRGADHWLQLLVPAALVLFVLGLAPDGLPHIELARRLAGVALVITATFALARATAAYGDLVAVRNPANIVDNLAARRLQTQVRVMVRVAKTVIIVFGFAAALMMFPAARKFGVSLLASAGVAGLAIGLAAKSLLGNLLAGLQIAFTQPIRIDDVLVVEGEFGRVEEINSSFVVVRIWDDRRLVVPLTWFIENPFQNWTRTGANVTNSIFLWLDYSMPLDPLRAEAKRIIESAPEWDQRFWNLQVAEMTETAMKIRILATAGDSSKGWDLQVRVREGLIGFVQQQYPQCLPRARAQVEGTASAPDREAAAIARATPPSRPAREH